MAGRIAALNDEKAVRSGLPPFALEYFCRVHRTRPTLRRGVLLEAVGQVLLYGPAGVLRLRSRVLLASGAETAGTNNPTQAIGDRTHAGNSGKCAPIRSSIRRATVLASGPVFPIGPTHVGQPFLHSQPAISSRVRRCSSSSIANNGSLKPIPPG